MSLTLRLLTVAFAGLAAVRSGAGTSGSRAPIASCSRPCSRPKVAEPFDDIADRLAAPHVPPFRDAVPNADDELALRRAHDRRSRYEEAGLRPRDRPLRLREQGRSPRPP